MLSDEALAEALFVAYQYDACLSGGDTLATENDWRRAWSRKSPAAQGVWVRFARRVRVILAQEGGEA